MWYNLRVYQIPRWVSDLPIVYIIDVIIIIVGDKVHKICENMCTYVLYINH